MVISPSSADRKQAYFPHVLRTEKATSYLRSESKMGPQMLGPYLCLHAQYIRVRRAEWEPDGQVEGSLAASLCSLILSARSVA